MRAVILDGAFAGDETSAAVEADLVSALAARGWEVERIRLRDLTIAYCKGCFGCWVKTPGVCPTRDDAGVVTHAFVRSDLAVLVTPVVFGGYSSELKKALDSQGDPERSPRNCYSVRSATSGSIRAARRAGR